MTADQKTKCSDILILAGDDLLLRLAERCSALAQESIRESLRIMRGEDSGDDSSLIGSMADALIMEEMARQMRAIDDRLLDALMDHKLDRMLEAAKQDAQARRLR